MGVIQTEKKKWRVKSKAKNHYIIVNWHLYCIFSFHFLTLKIQCAIFPSFFSFFSLNRHLILSMWLIWCGLLFWRPFHWCHGGFPILSLLFIVTKDLQILVVTHLWYLNGNLLTNKMANPHWNGMYVVSVVRHQTQRHLPPPFQYFEMQMCDNKQWDFIGLARLLMTIQKPIKRRIEFSSVIFVWIYIVAFQWILTMSHQ